jgi:hypothetical protein
MTKFETVWAYLQDHLKAGISITNWSAFRGYFGGQMMVDRVREHSIVVDTPKAKNLQTVPKDDFKSVWKVWSDYKSNKVKRYELRDMTRYSKYVISILHWYDEEVSNG